MKQFDYISKTKKNIDPKVLSVLSLIDAHPYKLPDTDMLSLGDLHNRLSVEFVDNCGTRTRTISMTMNEFKSLINSLEEKNKKIEKYNLALAKQEHEFRMMNNHAEANRIECQMKQRYYFSPIQNIYYGKLKEGYCGEDKIEFPQEVFRSGYYTRENDKPKVVVENSTIYGVIPTYIHEMMHAYYDEKLGKTMNDAEFAEEPLAEYGMLKFLKSFVNANPEYNYLLENALRNVRNKQQSLGLVHYGFGEYLYLNNNDIPWEQMLHGANPLIGGIVPEYEELIRMLFFVYPDESELPKVVQTLYDVLCKATGKKTAIIDKTVRASKVCTGIISMDIKTLCSAVKNSLGELKGARTEADKVIDHKKVVDFQERIKKELNKFNKSSKGYRWAIEQQCPGRLEKDSIDILGKAPHQPKWIIEIDATRTDQVSQKLLSRLTLWGKKNPIQYVAILYPDAHNRGQSACEKYLRYGNEIIKELNDKSGVTGIFVFPDEDAVEVVDFKGRSHFMVEGKECGSMNEAAAEAVTVFCSKHPVSYEELTKCWEKFVNKEYGKSRYKDIGISTTDGVPVCTYSQFREHGECSYWNVFEKLCKKNGIKVTKMRKFYTGKDKRNPFQYLDV